MNNQLEKTIELNIQPQAGILSIFSRINYKPWYAIAEFVDNSTASFLDKTNNSILKKNGIDKMTVDIKYDFKNNILTIQDDAFGMEIDDFKRAVRLDSIPKKQGGRNEFGMGLKTAASWFGNIWSVESTAFGSQNKYSTTVDILNLKKNELNSVTIKSNKCLASEHGTKIVIKNITKRIDGGRTKGKIISILQSMYRRDLQSGNITIKFNGEKLLFHPYECLTFRGQEWKKHLDFSFKFNDNVHRVTGFVGILKKGGYSKAGFALFRRERVVIGGDDLNYKPLQIFTQLQSQISLKLFGELNLDDFPIHQAKDGFIWDDGLEEEFIKQLKLQIQDYITIAKMSIKDRESEECLSNKISDKIYDKVRIIEDLPVNNDDLIHPAQCDDDYNEEVEKFKVQQNELNEPEQVAKNKREYVIPVNAITKVNITIVWSIANDKYWVKILEKTNSNIKVCININHPFFKPYSKKEEFKVVLEQLVVSYLLAEERAKLASDVEGYVVPDTIMLNINQILEQISELSEGVENQNE